MSELNEKYTRLSNDILEALARVDVDAADYRVFFAIARLTYGWQQKEAPIGTADLEAATGLNERTVRRSLRSLEAAGIIRTRVAGKGRGAKRTVGINKVISEWKGVEKKEGVPVPFWQRKGGRVDPPKKEGAATPLTEERRASRPSITGHIDPPFSDVQTPLSDAETRNGKPKIEPLKKEKEKKEITKLSNVSYEDMRAREADFKKLALEHLPTDEGYIEKLWRQGMDLRGDNFQEFARKVNLMFSQMQQGHPAAIKFARKLYHETAGLVNDRGEMEKKLTAGEAARRRQFIEEEYGRVSPDDSGSFL